MDYSRYLVLYSGGADSTYFIEKEPTATHLLHFRGWNEVQTRNAIVNANILNRYLTVEARPGQDEGAGPDGESNQIHALVDTYCALRACTKALHCGLSGIVLCFNADDLGIDAEALLKIVRAVEPSFEILQPLRKISEANIRTSLKDTSKLHYVSCMQSDFCGHCPKCLKDTRSR